MLAGFMRSADTRSLVQTYTYTYTIIRFFLTSVYAYLTLMAHPTVDLHDGRTCIFDGGSSHRAFETEDISAIHQLISDLGEYILLQFNEEELINYDRQKHRAPLLENVVTSTRSTFIKYQQP